MATVEQFALPEAKSFISLFRFHSKTVGGGKNDGLSELCIQQPHSTSQTRSNYGNEVAQSND